MPPLSPCGFYFLQTAVFSKRKNMVPVHWGGAKKKEAIFEPSPISCRLEILNSVYRPGARSSFAPSIPPPAPPSSPAEVSKEA